MSFTVQLPLVDSEMSQSIMEMPVLSSKDIMLDSVPTTMVEQVISTRMHEAIALDDEDDDCVICYATLYRPVKTECRHTACEACMLHWALAAMDECAEHADLPSNLTVDGIKFRCPTCRTYTTATFDSALSARLQARYPEEYASRAAEQKHTDANIDDEYATQTMLIMLGNSHRKIDPTPSPYTDDETFHHEWSFFLKSSQPDIIEQVQVILHPGYREDRLVWLRTPPFSLTRKASGYFTIFAGVQLKEGYEWVDEERAVNSIRDGNRDRLPFDWLLDFRGNGSQSNRVVRFRKVKEQEQEGETEIGKGKGKEDEDADMAELSAMREFMSEAEIEEWREVKKLNRAAKRAQEMLERKIQRDQE